MRHSLVIKAAIIFTCIVIIGLVAAFLWLDKPFKGDVEQDLIVRYRPGEKPISFNPLVQFKTEQLKLSEIGVAVSECVFDGLYNRIYDAESGRPDYVPCLAEKIESKNPDSKTLSDRWYVYIRNNIFWHGSRETVTPEDVIHTFQCIDRVSGSESPWRERLRQYMRDDPHTVDDKDQQMIVEFVFEVAITKSQLKQLLTFKIIPKIFDVGGEKVSLKPERMLKTDDAHWKRFNERPVGTGPYRLSKYKTSDLQIVLERDTRNDKNSRMPRNVIFRQLHDNELVDAMGKTTNLMLYAPGLYYNDISSRSQVEESQYIPYYFYSLIFSADMEDDQRKKVYCAIGEEEKADLLKYITNVKKDHKRYVNHGMFPWNWKVHMNLDKQLKSNVENCGPVESPNDEIILLRNEADSRTKELASGIEKVLSKSFRITTKKMPPDKFMNTIRGKSGEKFHLAIVVWEGFDQDYSISPLYTDKGNPLHIINVNRKHRPNLDTYFYHYTSKRHTDAERYKLARKIQDVLDKARPYHYLFTPPRVSMNTMDIENMKEFPIHPEAFLSNIRKWTMAKEGGPDTEEKVRLKIKSKLWWLFD